MVKSRIIFFSLFLLMVLAGVWFYDAWKIEPNRLEVDHQEFVLERWPAELDGFRVVQLSDFHLTHYGSLEHRTVSLVQRLHPDMIVLTGDYVGGRFVPKTPAETAECIRMIKDLHAPYGVWMIAGNNDIPEVMTRLAKAGFRILSNQNQFIPVKKSGFWLVGVNFPGEVPDYSLAFADLPAKAPKLVITHTPDSIIYAPAIASGIDLELFGHTHGGQIVLFSDKAIYVPTHCGMDLPLAGRFEVGGVKAYTNQGIGTNWVPLRFRCPPQVAELILRSRKK